MPTIGLVDAYPSKAGLEASDLVINAGEVTSRAVAARGSQSLFLPREEKDRGD
ncbi:hypothetical protein BHM03_00025383, partial [Ensete ventricosum]